VASHYGRAYGTRTLCAMTAWPRGTRIRVTNLENGKSVTAIVNDDGPHVQGRVVDLSLDLFRQVADPDDGLFNARVERLAVRNRG